MIPAKASRVSNLASKQWVYRHTIIWCAPTPRSSRRGCGCCAGLKKLVGLGYDTDGNVALLRSQSP